MEDLCPFSARGLPLGERRKLKREGAPGEALKVGGEGRPYVDLLENARGLSPELRQKAAVQAGDGLHHLIHGNRLHRLAGGEPPEGPGAVTEGALPLMGQRQAEDAADGRPRQVEKTLPLLVERAEQAEAPQAGGPLSQGLLPQAELAASQLLLQSLQVEEGPPLDLPPLPPFQAAGVNA